MSKHTRHWLMRCLLAFVFFTVCSTTHAALKLPAVLGSNMVIQQGQPMPVWGWATPGESVSVTFADDSLTTKADERGRWRVDLPARKATADQKPLTLTVKGEGQTLTLTNLLVGEVWVCSGQSNMDWTLPQSADPKKEIESANFPQIRLFIVPRRPAGEPQEDVQGQWQVCTPQTVPPFSAVGFFFGRYLHQELKVPVGLVKTAWGGTRIEPWTPKEGFKLVEHKELNEIGTKQVEYEANWRKAAITSVARVEAWVKEAKAAAAAGRAITPLPNNVTPGASAGNVSHLYNGMVAPLVPLSIRGAIWYQGESNLGQGMRYNEHMKALIRGWRSVWNQKSNRDFPFLYVQLAPFNYRGRPPHLLAEMWEAQLATLKEPNTGMAFTLDIGNVNDIHPKNKQDVGKRLALWALAKTYGRDMLVCSGPIFNAMKVDGNKVHVTFNHSANGLHARDGKPLTWFEVAGKDGKFVHAKAELDQLGQSVIVSSTMVDEPVHVRFAWGQQAEPNLENSEGLPAAPFRASATAAKP